MRNQLITTLCIGLLATMPTFATKILNRGPHLNFGTVSVGQCVTRDLNLTNEGDENLTITGISFHEYGEGMYDTNYTGGIIEPGQSQLVPITFCPTNSRSYNIAVYIASDKTNAGDRDRMLLGEAVPPVPRPTCNINGTKILDFGPHLNFGAVPIGLSPTKTLTLINNGDCNLTVSGITYHASTGGKFTGNWSGIIPPSSSQDVTITYTPTDVEDNTGKLYILSDRTNTSKERSRTLIGEGI